MAHEVKPVDGSSVAALRSFIDRNPVRHCFLASRIASGGRGFWKPTFPDILGHFDDGHLTSAVLLGANVVPVNTSQSSRREFADVLTKAGRRASSIVGPHEEALDLWEMLKGHWGYAREVRSCQPVMMMNTRSQISPDERVRYSTLADLDVVLPACIDMFTEEVGVSPVAGGSSHSYRMRISELISQRRSFVRIDDGEIIFKAEVGCVGAGVAQIQGVWVNPKYRGQGIAKGAMAAVVQHVIDDIAPTASLYVNDFNERAVHLYGSVGFDQVDTFATVLF